MLEVMPGLLPEIFMRFLGGGAAFGESASHCLRKFGHPKAFGNFQLLGLENRINLYLWPPKTQSITPGRGENQEVRRVKTTTNMIQ